MTKLRIAFFGTPDFAAITLEKLCLNQDLKPLVVVTQPDRPSGRGGNLKASAVKQTAIKFGIPTLQPEKIRNNEQFLTAFTQYAPFDIAVIVAFGQIIPTTLLNIPKAGFVNIHASLLPRWRGAAPLQRAILALDEKTGIALMKLEAGLDTGPVYDSAEIPIKETDNLEIIHDELATLGAKLIIQDIHDIVLSKLQATPQALTGVTYAEKIENEEALIDWQQPIKNISAKIRAFSPFPGAFTFISGKRLKIYNATVKDKAIQTERKQDIGSVAFCDNKNTLEICCSDGILALNEVQLEGKKRMPVADFLRGCHISKGMMLSNE